MLGFSQIGAESTWRVANSKSIKDAAEQAGIKLVFSDAQQSQANQLKAIKSFILQKVDVIAVSPVTSSGWREVLSKAKKAGIPVITLDRQIDDKDADLTVSFIGSDFKEEGRKIAQCMLEEANIKKRTGPIHIVELRGTEGSSPATQRKAGFAEIIKPYPNFKIIRSENGDFKETLGKELMQNILRETKNKGEVVHVVFAHNDNMAFGAIAALEAAGLTPGKDVSVFSIDAIRDAFVAMKQGKLNCTMECNPLLGPQLMTAVQDLMDGKSIPRRVVTVEKLFPASTAEAELPNRKY